MVFQHDSDESPVSIQDASPHAEHCHGAVDRAFFNSERGMWATRVSLVALFTIACFQMVVVLLAGSVALLADTVHTLSDLVATVPLWVAFALSKRSADKGFNYGYGRAEDLAGLLIVLSMALSAGFVGWQSLLRFIDPPDVQFLWAVMVAAIIGFIGNEAVAQFRIKVGKEIGSASLIADGHHARVDGLTSLLVLVGVIAVWLGVSRADPIIGLLITVIILRITWSSFKLVVSRLLDSVDPEMVDQVRETVAEVPGVQDVNDVRMRWMGHRLIADVSIAVAQALPIGGGHIIAQEVQRRVAQRLEYVCTVNVNLTPYGLPDEIFWGSGQLQELPEPVPLPRAAGETYQQLPAQEEVIPSSAELQEDESAVEGEVDAELEVQPSTSSYGHELEISWGSAFKVAIAVVLILLLLAIFCLVVLMIMRPI